MSFLIFFMLKQSIWISLLDSGIELFTFVIISSSCRSDNFLPVLEMMDRYIKILISLSWFSVEDKTKEQHKMDKITL